MTLTSRHDHRSEPNLVVQMRPTDCVALARKAAHMEKTADELAGMLCLLVA